MPKTNAPPKTGTIAVRLPEMPFRRLKARAERRGIGYNEAARNILIEFLVEEDTGQFGTLVTNLT
jgi:predicted DNA binding CopG/RHH family protein